MKLICLIASKARASRLKAMTGDWLFSSGVPYKVLVESQDMNDYWEIEHKLELPENDRGLSYSLNFGKQWALEHGYDVVFKIDDDVEKWTTMDKSDKKNSTNRFLQIIKDIEKPLGREEIGGISFGYIQEFWHNKVWFGVNQRFQSCYIIKTNLWKSKVYPKGDPGENQWEDLVTFLRVVVGGHKVLRYGRYQLDTTVCSGEGGLEEFYKNRTPEQYKRTIELVKAEFPWLKFKLKKNGFLDPDFDNPMINGKKL